MNNLYSTCRWGLIVLWMVTPMLVFAQVESDERPLLSVAKGISFSQDSLFLLNMRFRMQNRVGVRTASLEDFAITDIEARVRRLRLRFDGFVGRPQLQYYIQLAFSRADQDFDNGGEAKIIRDAIVYYTFNPKFYIGFGQLKLPGNRQRVNSSGNLQFADRSIANAAFTLDRDFGVFAYYKLAIGQSVCYGKAAVSTGEGRNITRTDNGLAYTLRAEWLPFSDFKNGGDYSEGDLEFEPKPKLSLALTYSHNDRTRQSGGQLGEQIAAPVDLTTWITDASFKWQGHAVLLEWFQRMSSANQVGNVPIPNGRAYNLQYSYTTRKFWEISFRSAQVAFNNPNLPLRRHEFLLGTAKYINKHRIKMQSHLGYQRNDNRSGQSGWFLGMFQIEFGI